MRWGIMFVWGRCERLKTELDESKLMTFFVLKVRIGVRYWEVWDIGIDTRMKIPYHFMYNLFRSLLSRENFVLFDPCLRGD